MFYLNKKILLILLFSCFGKSTLTAASSVKSPSGGQFVKRIEYNFQLHGLYNLKSKTDLEKLFFGDFNADLEFFVEPSFEGAYGFRIVRDSLAPSYIMELKHIHNFDEVNAQVRDAYPTMYKKQSEESLKRYEASTHSVPITTRLANTLYAKVVSAIDSFKGVGVTPMVMDGFVVTFRCVVEDEVWTFTIHQPLGHMRKLTDICNRIAKDAEANQHQQNEVEYITLLDDLGV